ncbi:MAG: hypothetical protein U0Q03_20375 [Acidimicrobiales bacterium]
MIDSIDRDTASRALESASSSHAIACTAVSTCSSRSSSRSSSALARSTSVMSSSTTATCPAGPLDRCTRNAVTRRSRARCRCSIVARPLGACRAVATRSSTPGNGNALSTGMRRITAADTPVSTSSSSLAYSTRSRASTIAMPLANPLTTWRANRPVCNSASARASRYASMTKLMSKNAARTSASTSARTSAPGRSSSRISPTSWLARPAR